MSRAILKELFDRLDENHNGFLEKEEMMDAIDDFPEAQYVGYSRSSRTVLSYPSIVYISFTHINYLFIIKSSVQHVIMHMLDLSQA